MQNIDFYQVELTSGYWFEKEKLNRETTINAVYEQFSTSGRIKAFDMDWREGKEGRPHFFWDSDVAKWMEGVAYILAKHPDPTLAEKLDSLIEKIEQHQGTDGYFNIYFTAVEPSKRFFDRDWHELYCAGHLIEAAIACDAIGRPKLLACMKRYVAYIHRVFVVERSAAFATPGHEELELALMRLYTYTSDKFYLSLAAHFINARGTEEWDADQRMGYNQSHQPVREQKEAIGHAVRALYLYTGMALLAGETGDAALADACQTLFEDVTKRKMYITGGVGSTCIGEAFTNAYDLPNDTAYAETCAAIALMFFCRAMTAIRPRGEYADCVERAFYNGVLSGLSLDGKHFFYTNPLEINLNEHFKSLWGNDPCFPITQRPEIFSCSCCPPNVNRLLPSLGNYIFSKDGDTLYIHQYTGAFLSYQGVECRIETDYPRSGEIRIRATGVKHLALRIPSWCQSFLLDSPFEMKDGYALLDNCQTPVCLTLDMTPHTIYASSHIARDAYRVAIMRGPVVYCAESIDNPGGELHRFALPTLLSYEEVPDEKIGLPRLSLQAKRLAEDDGLYSTTPPTLEDTTLHCIPYNAFANRGECDMRVWFTALL